MHRFNARPALVLALLTCLGSTGAPAQEPAGAPAAAADSAPVMVDGERLFSVAGITSFRRRSGPR